LSVIREITPIKKYNFRTRLVYNVETNREYAKGLFTHAYFEQVQIQNNFAYEYIFLSDKKCHCGRPEE
jgi:hypothetical protein